MKAEKNLQEQLNNATKSLKEADKTVKNAENLLNINVSKLNSEQRKEIQPFLRMLDKAKKCDDMSEIMEMHNKVNEAIKNHKDAS